MIQNIVFDDIGNCNITHVPMYIITPQLTIPKLIVNFRVFFIIETRKKKKHISK